MKKLTDPIKIRQEFHDLFLKFRNEGGKTIYGVTDLDNLKEHFQEYEISSVTPSRQDLQLHSKLVYTSREGRVLKSTDALYLRESRFLNRPLCVDFTIIGDSIVFVAKGTAYVIHDARLAEDFRSLFDLLWYAIIE